METLLRATSRFGVAMVAGGLAVNTCLFDVPGGYRGVVFDRFQGVLPKTFAEGTHFLIPLIQQQIVIDVRTTPRVINRFASLSSALAFPEVL